MDEIKYVNTRGTEETASQNPTARERIKTTFARIIVSGTAKKPCYNIMYFACGEMYIGFGSYKLQLVQKWLREEFDVRQNDDVVPVVRCRDCKHSYDDLVGLVCSHGVCVDCVVPPDFCCSYGERKEANDD